jgi:hypothetical protein
MYDVLRSSRAFVPWRTYTTLSYGMLPSLHTIADTA